MESWPDRSRHPLHIISAPSLGSREISEPNGYNCVEVENTRDGGDNQAYLVRVRRMLRHGERDWAPDQTFTFTVPA